MLIETFTDAHDAGTPLIAITSLDQSAAVAPAALQTDSEPPGSVEPPKYKDPFDAYQAGAFDQALQGFVDEQIEHPEDPMAALNVGSAHYGMRNYPEADRSFSMAALSAEPGVRQQAMYNLGNSAFRQGRLQEAVELYKKAVELDPEDIDAKFNLEYVRDEIRRRHEEAQNRQDQQQQKEQESQQEQDDPTENQDQGQEGSEQSQSQPQEAQDTDQDGIPDEVETSGENPTDPQDPDSDDDGLPDGSEDLNQNGRVDPQETDPNKVDSDGDGHSDAQEAAEAAAQADAAAEQSESLSPEEAERYLQALEEQRPVREDAQRGRRRRNDKDW